MEEFFLICIGAPAVILFFMIIANIKQINEYQRGVVFTMGKYSGTVGSGWRFFIPIFQSVKIIDIRTKTVDLADQSSMTKDNISVNIGAVVFFKIVDASKSVLEVDNFHWAITQLAETTMRSIVGEVELNELLANREEIAQRIESIIQPKAAEWGCEIVAVELKDVILPEDMKRTMAKQAEAQREKLSVITKAEGELIAAENLQKAAALMGSTPGALHLRTLSTLNDLSSDQSNTVVFAVPVEILRAFEGGMDKGSNNAELVESIVKGLAKKK